MAKKGEEIFIYDEKNKGSPGGKLKGPGPFGSDQQSPRSPQKKISKAQDDLAR
jgi:hypothetical protein